MVALGRQLIIELFDGDSNILTDARKVEDIFFAATKAANATVLWSYFHPFEPQGVSGVVVIAESHFTIHTWPEHNYGAIDVFFCSDLDINGAVEEFKKGFKTQEVIITGDLNRGLINNNSIQIPSEMAIKQPEYHHFSWKKKFQETESKAISSAIDLHGVDSSLMEDMTYIKNFIKDVCNEFKLEMAGETVVSYSEKENGYTFYQPLETSLLSGHFSTEQSKMFIDLYSSKYYEPREISEYCLKYFKGKHYTMQVSLRK